MFDIKNYDTVCYSIQHNLIQLIKDMVETGSSISGLGDQISDISGSISGIDEDIQQVLGLIETILQLIGDVTQNLELIATLVSNHEDRIKALEDEVFGE